MPTTIRSEQPQDWSAVRKVHQQAFAGPGEAQLVEQLRQADWEVHCPHCGRVCVSIPTPEAAPIGGESFRASGLRSWSSRRSTIDPQLPDLPQKRGNPAVGAGVPQTLSAKKVSTT